MMRVGPVMRADGRRVSGEWGVVSREWGVRHTDRSGLYTGPRSVARELGRSEFFGWGVFVDGFEGFADEAVEAEDEAEGEADDEGPGRGGFEEPGLEGPAEKAGGHDGEGEVRADDADLDEAFGELFVAAVGGGLWGGHGGGTLEQDVGDWRRRRI